MQRMQSCLEHALTNALELSGSHWFDAADVSLWILDALFYPWSASMCGAIFSFCVGRVFCSSRLVPRFSGEKFDSSCNREQPCTKFDFARNGRVYARLHVPAAEVPISLGACVDHVRIREWCWCW